ncbi:MAG: esterase-like activity of phytase family protein [Dongiaceae bacterium]
MTTSLRGHAPLISSPAMRLLPAVLCWLVAAPAIAADITVTATPVPLDSRDPQRTRVEALDYVAGFALDSTAPEWGGYSGMVLAADGGSLLAVSDVGHWLRLELTHDATGALTGVGAARIEPLLDEAGKPVTDKEWSDAEEVALASDGHLLVSFERRHRIWRYAAAGGLPAGPALPVPAPDGIQSLPENAGIEGMIADAAGNLTIVAEGAPSGATESRGWTWSARANRWSEFAIERSDGFEPTALALLPSPQPAAGEKVDHSLTLLLERRYTEADGPAARISVLFPSIISYRIASFTLATLRLPLSVDNFECLAVRPAGDGQTFVYILSDDNQSDKQRTLLLQFRARLLPFQTRAD